MIAIFWFLIAIGILYLWLIGHWFGWVLAFFPIFWIVQMSLASGHGADAPEVIAGRAIVVLVVTGVPCFLWGSIRRRGL